jgi:enoyl-CoA hydratase
VGMSTSSVTYEFDGTIATITLDDGKVNALSPSTLAAVSEAFDRAAIDEAIVVLAGRPGVFSGGFDLKVLAQRGPEATAMVRAGFELSIKVLSHPRPVVAACTGHAVAMGLFLLQSTDYRVGAEGPYRFVANEVAIGLTMPEAALAILRARLTPAAFERAVLLSEVFNPVAAVAAGILDRCVAPDEVLIAATQVAMSTASLDPRAHAASKLRVRQATVAAIAGDLDDFEQLPAS